METTDDNKENEIKSNLYVERDVLGLEKPTEGSTSQGNPKRIFVGLAIAIIILLVICLINSR